MPEPDLVLLHAPSVYDFRQEAILYGPIADFTPTPFISEIYPGGYASLAEYLEHGGYRVRVVNLAKHMRDDPAFDAEQAIAALTPIAFGIDFHWLSHAQGALAVGQIAKTVHPETPVILGGLAASYYHRELMAYPQVDYVLRGDSAEEPFLHLMECLSLGRIPDQVSGLTWRTRSGHVIENPLGAPLDSLDDLVFSGNNPAFSYQHGYPVALGTVARGCTQNCLTCGDSAYTHKKVYGRQSPCYRSPEKLAQDLHNLHRYHDGSIYVPCDITQPGMDYAYRFLRAMYGFPNLLCLDLLQPVPHKFLQDLFGALPHLGLQISMESHDEQVRKAMGKSYSNSAIEQTISDALSLGCERLDVHFTIGLPYQDYDSVMATVAYCDDLLSRFGNDGRLQPFIAPLAPFLDPGSIAFEESERHGYHLQYHSLEEHRRALLAPTWKHVLNYETNWMTADDIVCATYDATLEMAKLRARHGIIHGDDADAIEARVDQTRRLMVEIEQAIAIDDFDQLQDTLRLLKPEIDEVNQSGRANGYILVPRGKYVRRRNDSRGGGTRGSTQKVLRVLKDWLGRRYRNSRDRVDRAMHGSDPQRQTNMLP
jgi:B12-binding domain/radical SAM domain protein